MFRRILAALLCSLLFVANAHALTPGQRAVVLNGVQGWSLPQSSIDLNFARNAGSCTVSRILKPCAALLSITRTTTGGVGSYSPWAAGHYSLFADNTLRTTDQGLNVEQPATNVLLRSTDLSNAAWITSGITSAAPTVTGNAVIAPDGTLTAAKIVYPAVSAAGARSIVSQISGSGTNYTGSTYLKGAAGGEMLYICATPNNITFVRQAVTLTTSWQRFALPNMLANYYFEVGTNLSDGSQSATAAQTIYAWGAQSETTPFATSLIPTASAAVTRSIDNSAAIAAALTALQSPSGTIIIALNGGIQSLTGTILGINSLIGLGKTSGNTLTTTFGGAQTTANTVTWTGPVKVGLRWTPSSVGIVLNGGTIVSAANTPPAVTAAYIGSTSGSSAAINQNITRISVLPYSASDAVFQALTAP